MTTSKTPNAVLARLDRLAENQGEIMETQKDTNREIRALADRMTALETAFKGRCDLIDERFEGVYDDIAENKRKSAIVETITGIGAIFAAILGGLGLTK
jgi:flagellar motility protein MotE (MotC chaperone)